MAGLNIEYLDKLMVHDYLQHRFEMNGLRGKIKRSRWHISGALEISERPGLVI
jgi:hypothetical protein